MSGPNAAALQATGFPWTARAANAGARFRVSPAAVRRTRHLVEELHQRRAVGQREWLDRVRRGEGVSAREPVPWMGDMVPPVDSPVDWRGDPR